MVSHPGANNRSISTHRFGVTRGGHSVPRASEGWRPTRGDDPEKSTELLCQRISAQTEGAPECLDLSPYILQSLGGVPQVFRPHPCQLGGISPALRHLSLGAALPGVFTSILSKRKLQPNDSFTPPIFLLWIIQLHSLCDLKIRGRDRTVFR